MESELFETVSRRGAIAQVGLERFYTKGYHGTGMREIAERAGIMVSSLYNHFSGKQDLLVFILESIMRALIEEVSKNVDPNADASTQLSSAMRAHILFHARHQKESFVSDSELRGLEQDSLPRVLAYRDQYEEIFRTIVSKGVESGQFIEINPKLAVFGILSMCSGVAHWYRPEKPWKLTEIADGYSMLVVEGLRKNKDTPARFQQHKC